MADPVLPWFIWDPKKPLTAAQKRNLLVIRPVKIKKSKFSFPELRLRKS